MSFNLLIIGPDRHRSQLRPVLYALQAYSSWVKLVRLRSEYDFEQARYQLPAQHAVIVTNSEIDVHRLGMDARRIPGTFLERTSVRAGLRCVALLCDLAQGPWERPDLPVWVGYSTPVMSWEADASPVIKEQGGIPFLVDAATAAPKTDSGALTVHGVTAQLVKMIDQHLLELE